MTADSHPPVDRECLLLENAEVLRGIRRVVLEVPSGAYRVASPGQFVQVEVSPGPFPATRRPLTIDRLDSPDRLQVIFEEVGAGTSLLATLQPGATVRVLGPLGSGYSDVVAGRWLFVGGGLGAAGFPFLASRVDCSLVLLGASTAGRLLPLPGLDTMTATEDGSAGFHGLVTGLLDRVDWHLVDHVALCGPVPMMRAVIGALPPGMKARTQVSAEARMGCGWGACEGCPVPAAGGGTLKCCTDGPVFPAGLLDWDRWKGVRE
jgi:dihydroorotate dehydrogenase electron transfer subunit